jgi:transposase
MKKKYYISQKKSGSELCAKQDFWSMSGISLPAFRFEFSVEQASNRMIDNKGLIKVLKQIQLSFIVLLFKYKSMKKRFDYCVGIDISKLTLDVCILYECGNTLKTEYYKIKNNEKSIEQFVRKKLANYFSEQIVFCFEDTGIYSMPLSYYLSDNNYLYWQVSALEVKRSKGITRGKSDKTDSKDIAFYTYSQMHKFRQGKISIRAIQQLRLLFTEREKLLKSLSSFERTAENKEFVSKEVFHAVSSVNKTVVKHLKQALKHIEEKMLAIIESEETLNQQYKLITSIPGIGMKTAVYLLIATKGFDDFDNWRQLACYAGVVPFPYQSGTSIQGKNKVHPLADKKLKSLLNMCAICAVRHDRELKAYYERKILEGKPKMLVINNVRAKLLARVFAVINRKTPFVNTYKFAS